MSTQLDRYIPESKVAISLRPGYTWAAMKNYSPIRALELDVIPVDAIVDTLFIRFKCGTIVGVENPLMYPRTTNVRRGTPCLSIPIEACNIYTPEQAEAIMYKGVERLVF